ncbi:zinc ribbon domain-containing protein [Desulfobacterota bacterium AH_259_B03_O07]|nr:zinc ribbon domain-containing protein [Desulfobacterota bacterium AH_259_B03_O07]
MALIKCKDCGHDVSTAATSCPNCGAPPEIFDPLHLLDKKVKSTDKISRLDINTYLKQEQTKQEDAKRKESGKDKLLIYLLSIIFSMIFCLGVFAFFITYFAHTPEATVKPPEATVQPPPERSLGFRGNLGYENDEGFVPIFISGNDIREEMNDKEIENSVVKGNAFYVTRGTVVEVIGKGSAKVNPIYQIKLLGDGTQTQEILLEMYPKQEGWVFGTWIATVDDYLIQEFTRAKLDDQLITRLKEKPVEKSGLSEGRRKEIFIEIVNAEDRAMNESIQLESDIYKQIDLQRELEDKYKNEVAKKYNLTRDQLVKIGFEGAKNKWPMP